MRKVALIAVRLALVIGAVAACAHTINTLDRVTLGMSREQVLQNVSATPEFVAQGSTEYILFPVMASFVAMYRDTPYTILFVRLENGRVAAKGVVGRAEEAQIERLDPAFDLAALRRN